MPPVIILRGKTLDGNGTTVKLLRQVCITEEFLQRKAVPFDPILCCQVNSGICRESAVCDAAHNLGIIGLVNWSSVGPELTAKELVEILILCGIRLFQLTESVLQFKSLFKHNQCLPLLTMPVFWCNRYE